MEPDFITYQRFNDIVLAEDMAGRLEAHSIICIIEEEVQAFNPTFSYADSKEFALKIDSKDFERASEILNDTEAADTKSVEEDYYLFEFTDDELVDVVYKADEWNPFDVQLSRRLLDERGKKITDEELKILKRNRIEELKVNEPSQKEWIFAGYVCALLGGILGFFIGWHLFTYKKTLPNGVRFFAYSEHDRAQGKVIFYLSFVGLAIALFYKLLPLFSGR